MSKDINHDRRCFLRTGAMTVAATHVGVFRSANGQSHKTSPADVPKIKPGTKTAFGSLKQIDAGFLNVGYADAGPAKPDGATAAARPETASPVASR